MSPRRKSGLSPEDLQALKHLPAVLTALEHLQEQHAKVRALMGAPSTGDIPRWPLPFTPEMSALVDRRMAEGEAAMRRQISESHFGKPPLEFEDLDRGPSGPPERLQGATMRNPTLDTPERREYEEAKRAGRKVPVADPFANASPAQQERMAEQRAVIDAERAARGLPRALLPGVAPIRSREDLAKALSGLQRDEAPPETEEVAVRTETLETVSDGTTPLATDADDDPEVH